MGDVTAVAIRVERLAPLSRTATAQVAFHPGLGVWAAEWLQPSKAPAPHFLTALPTVFCPCWIGLKQSQCLGIKFKKKEKIQFW